MGWVAALILFGLMLPLGAMLYMDILEAKHEVKAQVEKVEKLRREIEKDKRDANPDRPK
jgi:cell division protein FtsB